MKKVMILGHGAFAISNIAQIANQQIGLAIVYDKKECEKSKNIFEPEPIKYIKSHIIEDSKIFHDKYGKPLENKGSKYHK